MMKMKLDDLQTMTTAVYVVHDDFDDDNNGTGNDVHDCFPKFLLFFPFLFVTLIAEFQPCLDNTFTCSTHGRTKWRARDTQRQRVVQIRRSCAAIASTNTRSERPRKRCNQENDTSAEEEDEEDETD